MAKQHSVSDVITLEEPEDYPYRQPSAQTPYILRYVCSVLPVCAAQATVNRARVSFVTVHQPPASETSDSEAGA